MMKSGQKAVRILLYEHLQMTETVCYTDTKENEIV